MSLARQSAGIPPEMGDYRTEKYLMEVDAAPLSVQDARLRTAGKLLPSGVAESLPTHY